MKKVTYDNAIRRHTIIEGFRNHYADSFNFGEYRHAMPFADIPHSDSNIVFDLNKFDEAIKSILQSDWN